MLLMLRLHRLNHLIVNPYSHYRKNSTKVEG
jgi:hypothetical protein